MAELAVILFALRTELLLFAGFFFLVGGADELVVDLVWSTRKGWRYLRRYRFTPPMRADQLPPPAQSGPFAILIPAWNEAVVIGKMLHRCKQAWRTGTVAHRIYVGCYPNDAATIKSVMLAATHDPNVSLILCDLPGPTTKADCLNHLWRALNRDELAGGYKFKAVVLHDAEDSVHPEALRIFDYLVEKAAAVQLPVIPIQVPGSAWVSGHYVDEFAEAHGKTLVVREAIGASMPLAGVGCAIERNALGRIAVARQGYPFDQQSLTEDYELGLGLGAGGGKVIFARMLDRDGLLVGTRACFPASFSAATRQKARWITGIALAGWDRLGWQGGWPEIWMRLRDRKAIFAALVLLAAYLCIAITAFLILAERAGLLSPPPLSPAVILMLWATSVLLVWRMLVRVFFVWSMHGAYQALLSIPRTLIANVIAIVAARRACWNYIGTLFGRELSWDKTNHLHFPEEVKRNA